MNRWAFVAALSGIALACWMSQEATAQEDSYGMAEVVRQDAPVRSGPNNQAYHCVRLSPPATVTIVSRKGDWLKILPPPGCYSVISKSHVRVEEGSQRGTVSGDNVWARAGGHPDKPGEFNMLQQAMSAGDRVRILGEIGEYYKIVPPRGSYFWISAADVREAGQQAPPTTAPAESSEPGAETPTTAPATGRAPALDEPEADPADAEVAAMKALDAQLAAEYTKPWDERDFDALLAKYKAMRVTEESGVRPYVEARIDLIETEIQRRADMKAAERIAAAEREQHEQYRAQRARMEIGAETGPAARFTAKGVITESLIFPGTMAVPKRYVLRDPDKLTVLAYLRATGGEALEPYTGKLVGLYGEEDFDREAGVPMIGVRKAVVLEEAPSLPAPAGAELTAPPAPATQPAKTDGTAGDSEQPPEGADSED